MASSAFFVGEGDNAHFLGGSYSDGYIQEQENAEHGGVPPSFLLVTTEEEFRCQVDLYIEKIREDEKMKGVSSWAQARGTQYIYCFFEGHVWVTCGGRWFNNFIPTNIKPPKATPSAPICRIGWLRVEAIVECGQCGDREALNHNEFKKEHPVLWTETDIYDYFQSKGWKNDIDQGWLCPEC